MTALLARQYSFQPVLCGAVALVSLLGCSAAVVDSSSDTDTTAGPVGDVSDPAVSITTPSSDPPPYTNAQTVTLVATASDDVAVDTVQFYDDAALVHTDASSPFEFAWSFTAANNGTHSFTAKAADAAGNTATSSPRVLTVNIAMGGSGAPPDIYYDTGEYSDMRNINLSGNIPLGAGEMPNQPPDVWTGLTWTYESWSDANGNYYVSPWINDPTHCRGSWCTRYDLTAGAWGDVMDQFGYSAGEFIPSTNHHTFFREYLKFPTGFSWGTSSSQGKLMYLRESSAMTVMITWSTTNSSGTEIEFFLYADTPGNNLHCNMNGGPCLLTGDDTWHSIEVELDLPNEVLQMWVDDVLRLSYTNTGIPDYDINDIKYGVYINAPGNGGGQIPAQSFWIDDMAVSTQRIGP